MIEVRDNHCYPMIAQVNGQHVFGGPVSHRGAIPAGTSVPLHKLLVVDLNDRKVPFSSSTLHFLPLYYPLKFGFGGPSMQYAVVSDQEIRILYMSAPEPDPADLAYVKVDAFPEVRYAVQPAIPKDKPLDWFTLTLGGTGTLDHKSDQCQNTDCPKYHSEPDADLIASIPPIPIPGHEDIWWDFEGAYMLFYFWLCRGCKTIMASNRST
jgi:hypothetical protein